MVNLVSPGSAQYRHLSLPSHLKIILKNVIQAWIVRYRFAIGERLEWYLEFHLGFHQCSADPLHHHVPIRVGGNGPAHITITEIDKTASTDTGNPVIDAADVVSEHTANAEPEQHDRPIVAFADQFNETGDKLDRIRKLVDICGLKGIMHRPIGDLSKGLKQRVQFS